MRIAENRVVQLVEGEPPTLVLVDTRSGEEVTLDPLELARFDFAAAYFRATGAMPSAEKACEAAGHPVFALKDSYAAVSCVCSTVLHSAQPTAWPGDTRPCRHQNRPGGEPCGHPELDLPSHGESFVGHTYLPERRAPRPAIGPGSDRRATVRAAGQWDS